MIHDSAIVSPSAQIGKNVKIGPYSIIGDNVVIGDDVEIMSHVCIDGITTIGTGTKIFPFASLGHPPQDLKYRGEKASLQIGCYNTIREYVTMHIGTQGGSMKTFVGDHNLFMVGVHIAHDCVVGNHIVMGNNATLAGHVTIEDNVIIGGLAAIHQFVRVGKNAVIGGMSGVERDVIPFGAVKGERAHLYDINLIGLKRANIERQEIIALQKAYEMLFSEEAPISDNIKQVEQKLSQWTCVKYLLEFMHQDSKRSFCLPKSK